MKNIASLKVLVRFIYSSVSGLLFEPPIYKIAYTS